MLLVLLPFSVVSIASLVSVVDVGGVGDGVTSNTAAFVRAVTLLKTYGGGTLLVPAVPNVRCNDVHASVSFSHVQSARLVWCLCQLVPPPHYLTSLPPPLAP